MLDFEAHQQVLYLQPIKPVLWVWGLLLGPVQTPNFSWAEPNTLS